MRRDRLTGVLLLGCFFFFLAGSAMGQSGRTHTLITNPQTATKDIYDAAIPPVLTINSGDTVVLNTIFLLAGQLRCGQALEEYLSILQGYIDRKEPAPTLTGPIYVNGAEPGDVLEVRIKGLVPENCGVNIILPGRMKLGGLPEDFPNGQMKTLQHDLNKMETTFAPGIVIPLKPFLGRMGVAPKPGESKRGAVPDDHGGNIDNKELVAGTTIYLPVNVKGALFSTGDAHSVQGDGESCLSAIETAMKEAVLQFIVRKDIKLERPMGETSTHWITMGFHKDLNEAVKIALREAVGFISKTQGLTLLDAYSLASLAVDLRVTQIVDGNKGIHAMIPKDIFKKEK